MTTTLTIDVNTASLALDTNTATLTVASGTAATLTLSGPPTNIASVVTSLPTAAVGYRGTFLVLSATSVPDKLYCCLRLADGTYDWVEIP